MPRVRSTKKRSTKKFDSALDELTAIEQQAIAHVQWLIELKGGLSHKYSQDYWRFSTKAELCGQAEPDERFVQGIKDHFVKKHGEVSIRFLPGPGKWDENLLAKLVSDAKQGDADADQVLREAAAESLERGELPPEPLLIYAATALRARPSRKQARQQPNSNKPQSHKTDYRDWILALTVDDIARYFNLTHTRNDATEKHCACSIVALATGLGENTVQNAWDDYKDVADQQTATNYVPQAVVSVAYDSPRSHLIRRSDGTLVRRPRVVDSDGTQEHILVRFPRVGSPEAMARPSNRKIQRAKRAKAQRAKRVRI